LAKRVDVNKTRAPGTGFTPLEWAARKGNASVIETLVRDCGADPRVGTPILWACFTNRLEVAKLLDRLGASASAVTESGESALHYAARNGSIECLDWLLNQKRLDPLATDHAGQTPLDHAELATALPKYNDVVDLLTSAVAAGTEPGSEAQPADDVSASEQRGGTPAQGLSSAGVKRSKKRISKGDRANSTKPPVIAGFEKEHELQSSSGRLIGPFCILILAAITAFAVLFLFFDPRSPLSH